MRDKIEQAKCRADLEEVAKLVLGPHAPNSPLSWAREAEHIGAEAWSPLLDEDIKVELLEKAACLRLMVAKASQLN